MTTIVLVLVVNHNHINGLHLFSDILYYVLSHLWSEPDYNRVMFMMT